MMWNKFCDKMIKNNLMILFYWSYSNNNRPIIPDRKCSRSSLQNPPIEKSCTFQYFMKSFGVHAGMTESNSRRISFESMHEIVRCSERYMRCPWKIKWSFKSWTEQISLHFITSEIMHTPLLEQSQKEMGRTLKAVVHYEKENWK